MAVVGTPIQQQPPTYQQSPVTAVISSSDYMRLLEVSTGGSLELLPKRYFYSHSPLLPLAQLDDLDRMFVIWGKMVEVADLEDVMGIGSSFDSVPFNLDMDIKIIEDMLAVVGQTSRAMGGKERELMSTIRTENITPQQQQQPQGIMGKIRSWFDGGPR